MKLLCKGVCSKVRWAEMDVDYPGEQVLRKASLREFTANCLKCGAVAQDPYNWFRP